MKTSQVKALELVKLSAELSLTAGDLTMILIISVMK